MKKYYYAFLSEEESDIEGGVVIIEDKDQYDNDFDGIGLEHDQHQELFSILDEVSLDQEQENNFTNYSDLTEEAFVKLFEGHPSIQMIHKPDMVD